MLLYCIGIDKKFNNTNTTSHFNLKWLGKILSNVALDKKTAVYLQQRK